MCLVGREGAGAGGTGETLAGGLGGGGGFMKLRRKDEFIRMYPIQSKSCVIENEARQMSPELFQISRSGKNLKNKQKETY